VEDETILTLFGRIFCGEEQHVIFLFADFLLQAGVHV